MKWTLKLGQLAGIDVYVHATFLLLLLIIALLALPAGAGTAVAGVLFVILVFGCVLLHELGHALAARRYGIRTQDIILLPMGGVARMERLPENPRHEIAVALAGPAVNVVIAVFLSLAGDLFGTSALERLLWVNIMLVAFNLIPAFPMDGGRVLRALLAMRRPHHEATALAAQVGKAFAILFGLWGLFTGNFILTLVAVFIFTGAGSEARVSSARQVFDNALAGDAALSTFQYLNVTHTLADAVRASRVSAQRDFPVLDWEGNLTGLLTEADLVAAYSALGPDAFVSQIMRRDIPTADPNEPLVVAVARLRSSGFHSMPLLRNDRIIGLMTAEKVAQYMTFRGRPFGI